MTDILIPGSSDNMGGLSTLQFALLSDVASISGLNSDGITLEGDVTFNEGGRWYKMQATIETSGLDYKSTKSNHGDNYNPKIVAFIPQLTAAIESTLQVMQRNLFLVQVTDNGGNVRLCGTLDAPMNFTNDGATGAKTADKKGTVVSFFGETATKPFFVSLG